MASSNFSRSLRSQALAERLLLELQRLRVVLDCDVPLDGIQITVRYAAASQAIRAVDIEPKFHLELPITSHANGLRSTSDAGGLEELRR